MRRLSSNSEASVIPPFVFVIFFNCYPWPPIAGSDPRYTLCLLRLELLLGSVPFHLFVTSASTLKSGWTSSPELQECWRTLPRERSTQNICWGSFPATDHQRLCPASTASSPTQVATKLLWINNSGWILTRMRDRLCLKLSIIVMHLRNKFVFDLSSWTACMLWLRITIPCLLR